MKKKFLSCLLLILTLLSVLSNFIYASTPITEAYIDNLGHCGEHLKKWNNNHEEVFVQTFFVAYRENGKVYPAYCQDIDLNGVGTLDPYSVDISEKLSDIRVWRVIVNGFPYKTPSQLGVENEYDAFVATKEAIYCVQHNFDISQRYIESKSDERGKKILNAIIKMVDAGRNGTQTPYDDGVTADRVGELKEDGSYYSQEFKLNCGVTTSKFLITSTENLPTGTKITNMSDKETTTFTGSEHFKVKIPKNEMNKDINFKLSLRASAETYPIFFGRTRIPLSQNYAVTYEKFENIDGSVNFTAKVNTGKIQIHKIDDETSTPIEGVTFQLLKNDGTVVANAITDKNGNATFSKLYQGNYVLKEISTNDNYILNNENFDINVNYNKTTNIEIENEHKKGNLKIFKIDKDNNKIAIGNVEFDLYSKELSRVISTHHTDINGEILIENLRIGNYSLIEKSTNKWYNLAENTDVKVEWNTTTNTTIENELKKGQVKITKVDLDNNEIKLEGVKFGIYDENNKLLETVITNENGEALTSKYPVRDYEKLVIKEIETLDNYVLNKTSQTVTLEENKVTDIQFENEKIKGYIEILKTSKDDNKYTKASSGSPLEMVTFEVYDSENNLVQTLKTDKTGKAITNLLLKGTYTIKEIDTGSKYYLLNDNEYTAEIKNHMEKVLVNIENESVNISVDVNKSGYKETQKNDIIKYDFCNIANNSNTYLDSFKWTDYLPTDYIRLNEIVTGTWNQDINYYITYKTNLDSKSRILADNLNSKENYKIDCINIDLQEGEYITEYCFEFGKVNIEFKEENAPYIFCKVLNTVKDKDLFVNHTETFGEYKEITDIAISKCATIVYEKDVQAKKLPKTGN